jgi:hypothetical protein
MTGTSPNTSPENSPKLPPSSAPSKVRPTPGLQTRATTPSGTAWGTPTHRWRRRHSGGEAQGTAERGAPAMSEGGEPTREKVAERQRPLHRALFYG